MRPVKLVLLGSAAGLFAVAGAQAADLAVKAKPVEYVKVCSLYGAGFWYVPGTDTCIKVGAFVKLDVAWNADAGGGGGPSGTPSGYGGFTGYGGGYNRIDNSLTYRERGAISFDMRQQTEYGTLRSYLNVGQDLRTNASGVQGGATVAPLGNTTAFGPQNFWADRAFIQFAGITVGRMRSFFDFHFNGAYALVGQKLTGDTSPNGILGIAYTWQFGGGLSASLSLEDGGWANGGRGRTTINLAGGGAPVGPSDVTTAFGLGYIWPDNKGAQMFDPVANIRLDQAWGFVGASFALHDASGGYYGCGAPATAPAGGIFVATGFPAPGANNPPCVSPLTPFPSLESNGHPADKWGWATSVGFTVVNPFGLQGDSVGATGVYSQGAIGYNTGSWGASTIFNGGQNLGLSYLVDGVYNTGTGVELTRNWSVTGYYEHIWSPQWRTSIYGGLLGTSFDSAAKAMICPGGAGGTANPVGFSSTTGLSQSVFGISGIAGSGGVTNCNPDSSWSQLGTRTMWNPVPDLDVGFDVQWTHLNTAFAGSANIPGWGTIFQPFALAKAPGPVTIANQDVIAAAFRIQRNFLY